MLLSLHFPNIPLHFVLVGAKEGGYLQKDSLAGNVQWGMKRELPESCSFLILMTTQRKHTSWLNVTMAAIVRHTHKEKTNSELDIHNQQTCIRTNTQSLCVHAYFCKHYISYLNGHMKSWRNHNPTANQLCFFLSRYLMTWNKASHLELSTKLLCFSVRERGAHGGILQLVAASRYLLEKLV